MNIEPKDLCIQTFNTGSAWMPNNNGVKLTHKPSGMFAECYEHRSQHRNKQAAFEQLVEKLKDWNGLDCYNRSNYRTQIGNLIAAIQAAAIEGFALRCVAAGSMWATFELTAEEVAKLQQHKIFLEEDK